MKRVMFWISVLCIALLAFGLGLYLFWGLDKESQLQRQANRGDVQAIMELAEANESLTGGGFIRKPNTQKSRELYRKAAALGHAPAMYALSQFLTDTITNEERVMWLKKGAELGSKACMVELMNGYQSEQYGLPRDIGAFLYWEAQVSATTRKENGMSPEEIVSEGRKGEVRRRRDWKYDGPIRPLP